MGSYHFPQQEATKKVDAVKREIAINIHNRVRAKNIFSAPLDLNDNLKIPNYPKSDASIQFINNALADNFIFASLTAIERHLLINAMMMESVPTQTVIAQQGEVGDFFYVVEEGHVSFSVDGNHVGTCTNGGSFGELALLYNCRRAATCTANTPCRLWKVDQHTFRYILANYTANQQKDIHDVLRKIEFLSNLEDSDSVRISEALTSVTFHDGDRIVNKGDAGELFYIVREGTVKVHDIGFGDSQYVDQHLVPGDWFGERALITCDRRAANVTATSSCTCLCLSRDTFEKVLGPLQDRIDHALKKRVLMGVPIFANSMFESYELECLTDQLREVTFKQGEMIAEEGKPSKQCLYIIRRGQVVVANSSSGVIITLVEADYFGDSTIKNYEGALSTQTITAATEVSCSILTRAAIESIVGDIKRLGQQPSVPAKSRLSTTLRLNDLDKLRILGVGNFGKVWLVNHEETRTSYALKQLNKHEIIRNRQVEGVIREKNIMSSLDHPFIVNVVATFQDERCLYMLIELVQGGELFSVIHTETRDGIANENARFYAACILESLSYLHHRNICYRDLKPENILIDSHGYCVLVDLGFAKVVVDKTHTLCGTPEYLAPEIILSKGHDKGVGILIYEMLVGHSPFYAHGTDQVSLFKRILDGLYSFPPGGIIHEQAEDLVKRLIIRRQVNRLGCLARADLDVREHPWFDIVDWDKLVKKQISAPWIPHIRDPLDASHFDTYSQEEDDIPSNQPHLPLSQQRLFQNF